jgi:hypothetical protein
MSEEITWGRFKKGTGRQQEEDGKKRKGQTARNNAFEEFQT